MPEPEIALSPWPRRLALLWTAFIIILLSIPGNALPVPETVGIDKVAHIFLFLILAFLWQRHLDISGKKLWLLIAAGIVFAIGSELYQEVMPIGRYAESLDAVADALGFIMGIGLWSGIRGRDAKTS